MVLEIDTVTFVENTMCHLSLYFLQTMEKKIGQNEFENSDFVYMLNQAAGDRTILAKQLNISPHQLSYVTNSNAGEGLLFYGSVIIPFIDHFPKDTELYRIMTTRPEDLVENTK